MAKSASKPARRPPHPLQTFRFVTGLTREACGKIAELTAATVQNIELGKAPLYLENAEMLEAYTGCNSVRLLELQQQWKDGKLKARAELVTLDGQPFTSETYVAYKALPVPKADKVVVTKEMAKLVKDAFTPGDPKAWAYKLKPISWQNSRNYCLS
jgi:hypothetical protein